MFTVVQATKPLANRHKKITRLERSNVGHQQAVCSHSSSSDGRMPSAGYTQMVSVDSKLRHSGVFQPMSAIPWSVHQLDTCCWMPSLRPYNGLGDELASE
jgi:hypothetical protein